LPRPRPVSFTPALSLDPLPLEAHGYGWHRMKSE